MRLKSSLGEIDMPDGMDNRSGEQTFEWLLDCTNNLHASQLQPSVVSEAVPQQLSARFKAPDLQALFRPPPKSGTSLRLCVV